MEADDVERNGQRVVADMRGTLEKLAQRIESLKKAKELVVVSHSCLYQVGLVQWDGWWEI